VHCFDAFVDTIQSRQHFHHEHGPDQGGHIVGIASRDFLGD